MTKNEKCPIISVIIPVYNAAQWLQACISSIQSSVSEHVNEVEILLVNDGSTDDSGRICDEYAVSYSNIHVFHKTNGGVASARTVGLEHARGCYYAWVDPDDYVSTEWFPMISKAIHQENPDVIVMDTLRVGDGPDKLEVYGRPAGNVDRDVFVADVVRDLRMLSGMPNKVMRSSLFEGVQFDPNLPILEDYAAILQILEFAKKVFYIPSCLYYYRQHGGSLLHCVSEQRAFQSVQIALEREKTVKPCFRGAAATAVAVQALYFCRNHYLYPDYLSDKDKLRFCRTSVRKRLGIILGDPEVPKAWKLKFALLAWDLYGLLIKIRKPSS